MMLGTGSSVSTDYDRDCPRCGAGTEVHKTSDEFRTPMRTCPECPWAVSKTSTTYIEPSLDERLTELEARIDALEAKLGGDD
jgi:ribosomal protein S27AE